MAGKSLSGYLVFEVETNGKYELEYEKKIYNPKQKIKGFKLTIDPAKYPNQVAERDFPAERLSNCIVSKPCL